MRTVVGTPERVHKEIWQASSPTLQQHFVAEYATFVKATFCRLCAYDMAFTKSLLE